MTPRPDDPGPRPTPRGPSISILVPTGPVPAAVRLPRRLLDRVHQPTVRVGIPDDDAPDPRRPLRVGIVRRDDRGGVGFVRRGGRPRHDGRTFRTIRLILRSGKAGFVSRGMRGGQPRPRNPQSCHIRANRDNRGFVRRGGLASFGAPGLPLSTPSWLRLEAGRTTGESDSSGGIPSIVASFADRGFFSFRSGLPRNGQERASLYLLLSRSAPGSFSVFPSFVGSAPRTESGPWRKMVRTEPENFSPWHRSFVPANIRHSLEFKGLRP